MSLRVAAALLAAVVVAHVAGARAASAQAWRTLESSRQARGEPAPLDVRVEYAAGTIDLRPTSDAVVYRMSLRYDAERSAPIATFDDAARTLVIGTHSSGPTSWRKGTRDGSSLRAVLTDRAPVSLTLELGATQAAVQLGGLRLRDLDVRTGATHATIDVESPNAESPGSVAIDVGAADVTVTRAGNLRAARARLNVGAGALEYDLAGDWSGDTQVSANVALGELRLVVPEDAGVRVSARTFLADFGKAGLVKHGDRWESPGYDEAKRRVHVDATATFGALKVVRR